MPQTPGPRISTARRQIIHAAPPPPSCARAGTCDGAWGWGWWPWVVLMPRPQRAGTGKVTRTGRWRMGIFQELTFRLPVKAGAVAAMSSWNDGRSRRRGRAQGVEQRAAPVTCFPPSLLSFLSRV